MTPHIGFALSACCAMLAGCGARMESSAPGTASYEATVPSSPAADATPDSAESSPPHLKANAKNATAARKIVYRTELDLVVERFDSVSEQIESLAKKHGGFVSAASLSGSPGSRRTGRWTIRIPVNQFADFVTVVRQLGEVRSSNTMSDDVTAEYYDIEARIHNKKQEEERLLKLLSDATGKLDDILAVEKELSRVRGEIEQAQGRLRVMADLVDLTTVTVTVTEIKNYVPEQSPTYMTRVKRAWAASTAAFVETAQATSILFIALVPWLLPPLILVLGAVGAYRLLRRRSR